jgi:glyoxylase I family protein
MEKVSGIGGLFFRAKDPTSLAAWYTKHLGIAPIPTSYGQEPWHQSEGPTAFAPFPESTDYFGKTGKSWMVNFRVRNLEAMVAQLEDAGIQVSVDVHDYPNGRFARLHDPEGNPIELWEPRAEK